MTFTVGRVVSYNWDFPMAKLNGEETEGLRQSVSLCMHVLLKRRDFM